MARVDMAGGPFLSSAFPLARPCRVERRASDYNGKCWTGERARQISIWPRQPREKRRKRTFCRFVGKKTTTPTSTHGRHGNKNRFRTDSSFRIFIHTRVVVCCFPFKSCGWRRLRLQHANQNKNPAGRQTTINKRHGQTPNEMTTQQKGCCSDHQIH
jgi:hypothetical protein